MTLPSPRLALAPRLLLGAAALAATGVGPGCVGTRTGRPEVIGTRNVDAPERADIAADDYAWAHAVVGGARPRTVGFVKAAPVDVGADAPATVKFVYDADFVLAGRVSSRGETYRLEVDGSETHLGSFSDERAVLVLLTGDLSQELALRPMPAPARRSLEGRKRGLAAAPGQRKAVTTW